MQVYKRYVFTESEIREHIEILNRDLIRDTFDNKYFIDALLRDPGYIEKPLREILSDCEVMMLDAPDDFRDLATYFLEHWYMFDMLGDLGHDLEQEHIKSQDIELVIKRDNHDDQIVFTKSQLLEHY